MLIVRTDKTEYGPHETILITLTLQNDTSAAKEYSFPSMQRFDVLSKRDGQTFWCWGDDRLFPHVFTKITILPGDSRVFKVEWNQLDIQGQKVPAGVYTIHARIVHHEEEHGSTVIQLGSYSE